MEPNFADNRRMSQELHLVTAAGFPIFVPPANCSPNRRYYISLLTLYSICTLPNPNSKNPSLTTHSPR